MICKCIYCTAASLIENLIRDMLTASLFFCVCYELKQFHSKEEYR